MDFKYKHFRQERLYKAEPFDVIEAARDYVDSTLGWKVSDSEGGLFAEGVSFSHAAKANLRTQSTADGTKLIVELDVERAGPTGFMLFDFGGYYSIQIRKWLDGVQWNLHQKFSADSNQQSIQPLPVHNRGAACFSNGCVLMIGLAIVIYVLINVIAAITAEITGTLYIFGRGRPLILHGLVARVMASLILLVFAFIGWKIATQSKKTLS